MIKKLLSRRTFMTGFTLIELIIVLIVVGLMTTAFTVSLQMVNESSIREQTQTLINKAELAVINFALANNRLPCPDTNSDGVEDCGGGVAVGTVPFQTMRLDAKVIDASGQNITYSIYRNPAAQADLGVLTELKNAINGLNLLDRLDFCASLKNAQTAAAASNLLSVSLNVQGIGCLGGADFINVAFLLTSSGIKDADNLPPSNRFDQENNTNPALCFASPKKAISSQYDDLLAATSFSKLDEVICSY